MKEHTTTYEVKFAKNIATEYGQAYRSDSNKIQCGKVYRSNPISWANCMGGGGRTGQDYM